MNRAKVLFQGEQRENIQKCNTIELGRALDPGCYWCPAE